MASLVEVFFLLDDYERMIGYYTYVFGTGKQKPTDGDIRLIRKLETMRDAQLLEDEFIDGFSKKK